MVSVTTNVLAAVVVVLFAVSALLWLARLLNVRAWPALAVLASQVAVAVVVYVLVGPFFLALDGVVYDAQAMGVVKFLRGEVAGFELTPGKEGWPLLLAAFYWLIGRAPLVGILFNGAVTSVTVLFVAKAASVIWPSVNYRLLGLAFLTSPLIVFLGPSLLREALCWLGTSMFVCGLLMFLRSHRGAVSVALTGAVVLLLVRTSLAVLVIAATGFVAISAVLIVARRVLAVSAMALLACLAIQLLGNRVLGGLGFGEDFLEANRQFLSDSATTGFAATEFGSDPMSILVGAAQILPTILLGPPPTSLSLETVWIWVGANAIWWLSLLALVGAKLVSGRPRLFSVILVTASLLVLLGMSITLTNYGIVARMRGTPTIMLLPIVVGAGRHQLLQRPLKSIDGSFSLTGKWLPPRYSPLGRCERVS